ncbi:MAG TPA: hypothetical protein VKU41_20865, partial [Polyangiaceae bacterium]|nr:hypothetical protein [Polyangiaceae bacterium]
SVASILEGLGVSRSRMTTLRSGATHEFAGGAPGTGTFAAQPGQPASTAGTLRANRRVVIEFVRTASTLPSP